MVSLQASLSPKERAFYASTTAAAAFLEPSRKRKRKREEQFHAAAAAAAEEEEEEGSPKELKLFLYADESQASPYLELQLEDSPLPPDWQRCLDIESGRISFYNTRTRSRTLRDPRRRTPPCLDLNLDLNLNLSCDAPSEAVGSPEDDACAGGPSAAGKPMVAAVCMRCHMLVMLRRTSPSCPNCKFLHPSHLNPFLSF